MKKTVLIALLLVSGYFSQATIIPGEKPIPASSILLALPGSNHFISLKDMTTLTPSAYYQLTGKRLHFSDRIKLMLLKREAKRMVLPDGTINQSKIKKQFILFRRHQWNWGGFALGFLLVIGPLIALFFHDENKWDRFWTAMDVNGIIILLLSALIAAYGGGL